LRTLEDLAGGCQLSISTLTRIETGHRRIGPDQLSASAFASRKSGPNPINQR